MSELRGAMIGCGFFAINQLHGWEDAKGASITAICDKDPERLRLVGAKFGISRQYEDASAMLAAEKPDFADIATTVSSHRQLVELAARHKVHAICQKPFAPTLDDAKAMIAACDHAGVQLMIHENFRWQTPIRAVRRVIESGVIGEPFWGRVSFRSAYDVFSGQPYLAQGKRFIIEDLGIHALDIARFLFGDAATMTARTSRINLAIKGEDVATMLLGHQSGVTSIVDCSYATRLAIEPFPQTLVEVDGADGTLRLHEGYRLEINGKNGRLDMDVSPALLPWAERPWHNIQESVALIQQNFADCLVAKIAPPTTGADNLKTFALVEAAYRSAASGMPVNLADLLS